MTAPADFLRWPIVPDEDRPKKLFHMGLLDAELTDGSSLIDYLRERGWEPVDVRLMANRTDADRAEAIKGYLEGIRVGSIEADPKSAKFLEHELRVYGMAQGKTPSGPRSDANDTDSTTQSVDIVLNSFGTGRSWTTTADEKAVLTKKKTGRPVKEEK